MIYLVTGTLGTGKTAMVVDMILNNVDGLFKMTIEDGTVVDRPDWMLKNLKRMN